MIKAIAISQNNGMSKKKTKPVNAEPSLFNAGEKPSREISCRFNLFFRVDKEVLNLSPNLQLMQW